MKENAGERMYDLIAKLFPICRSITGDGFRKSLQMIQDYLPETEISVFEVPTGTQVFDWKIPDEWNIRDAYIENSSGERIVDFKRSNLYVLGYSGPVDKTVSLEELQTYLYSLPAQPDVIPYMTSYYKKRIGFCIEDSRRKQLKEDTYHMYIDSEWKQGHLTYGEVILPGKSEKEVFFSTYLCHPSMANNELSGPGVVAELIRYVAAKKERNYTYRFIFIPETIGALTYLSRNLEEMKRKIIAGFNVTCVGDERAFSYVESRYGNTYADRVARNVLRGFCPQYKTYSFLERGSDERQYNMPGIDLPVVSIMRSKLGEYPEYHTSADDLTVISPKGLADSYRVYVRCIETIEHNACYRLKCLGEPQLGRRNLYSTLSSKDKENLKSNKTILNLIAYMDGSNDLIDISDRIHTPFEDIRAIADKLLACGLISGADGGADA